LLLPRPPRGFFIVAVASAHQRGCTSVTPCLYLIGHSLRSRPIVLLGRHVMHPVAASSARLRRMQTRRPRFRRASQPPAMHSSRQGEGKRRDIAATPYSESLGLRGQTLSLSNNCLRASFPARLAVATL
jgi:hypothetical protein